MMRPGLCFVALAMLAVGLAVSPGSALAQSSKTGGVVTAVDPGQNAFAVSAAAYISTNGNNATTLKLYPVVPVGKRFVIESIGLRCSGDLDDSFPSSTVTLVAEQGADAFGFPLPTAPLVPSSASHGASTQTFAGRLYTVSQVALLITHSKQSEPGSEPYCWASASGYLIDYKP